MAHGRPFGGGDGTPKSPVHQQAETLSRTVRRFHEREEREALLPLLGT